MANTKILADGNGITVWLALPNFASDPANPTAGEINAALDITGDVSWDGYSFGAQASNQVSDPSLRDVGNTQTRGFAQFGGSISFFYPSNYTDLTDSTVNTFLALEQPRTLGYLIIRVDGEKTSGGSLDPFLGAQTGDFVSIYRVMSDGWDDQVEGENNFKYTITFLPQGDLWVNTIVGAATVATPAPIGAPDYTVGGLTPLGVHYAGRELASVATEWDGYPGWFRWESDNPAVASVDRNGVVHGVTGGTANIVARSKNTNVASTPLAVTIV